MTQPTIQERRDRAASLLHDYSLHAKRSQSCEAADLLCDLLHWLDAEDLDIDDKIYQARTMYEQEVKAAEDAAKCATAHQVISDAEFLEHFAPVKNHLVPNAPFDGCMFETFGAEFEHVRAQDPALIWTVVDCDGTLAIESGCHLVNRLGYLVASRPRLDEDTYSVEDDADEPEDKTVAVNLARLRHILDYLHDSEADHYDPETYPDDAKNHVYAHVLAIEEDLKARTERGAQ